jgi:hypothetical protein
VGMGNGTVKGSVARVPGSGAELELGAKIESAWSRSSRNRSEPGAGALEVPTLVAQNDK